MYMYVNGYIICKKNVVNDVIHVDAFTLGPGQMLQHLNNHLFTLILVLKFNIQTFEVFGIAQNAYLTSC